MSEATPPPKPDLQYIEGVPFPALFNGDCIRSAIQYKPRPDDLFLVTYPKCGTTWTQHILLLILSHGEPLEDQMKFFSAAPFLEITGAKAAESMPRPGPLKVHLPFQLTPWNDSAKYIYVTRNPFDCCVSFYYHQKNMPGFNINTTFDDFFENFLTGEIEYGDYFDHLLGWYEHRNDSNVHFVTYEQLKEQPKEAVLKMASFIDDKLYAEPLRIDPEKLENVIKYSSFDYMKDKVNTAFKEMISMPKEELLKSSLPDQMKQMVLRNLHTSEPPKSSFIRKGIIGDWKNHFSEEQKKRLEEKFFLRTKGTDIPKLWEKYMQ